MSYSHADSQRYHLTVLRESGFPQVLEVCEEILKLKIKWREPRKVPAQDTCNSIWLLLSFLPETTGFFMTIKSAHC